MKSTTYSGINYAGTNSRTNRDESTGIHYGVISCNSVNPEALEDIYTHGEDKAWGNALKEAIAEATREGEAQALAKGEEFDPSDIDEDSIADNLGMNWETDLSNYAYERDGYALTGCLSNDVFVMRSPFYTFAQFCSPCVPGAGNLDSPFEPANPLPECEGKAFMHSEEAKDAGFPRVYCLGHDWFDDSRAPYAVFSVETGKLVLPPSQTV